VLGAAFGLRNEVLKTADQASFLTRVSGRKMKIMHIDSARTLDVCSPDE
jgi:hypothetical protein